MTDQSAQNRVAHHAVFDQPVQPGWGERNRRDLTRRKALDVAKNRLLVLAVMMAGCFLILSFRLADMTLLDGGGETRSRSREVVNVPLPPRAEIHDRNNVVLATSLPTRSLFVNPRNVLDKPGAAKKLAAIIPDLKEDKIRDILDRDVSFAWVRRHLPPQTEAKIWESGVTGIGFRDEFKRVYPQGRTAAHVLGAMNTDNVGIAGLERKFDASLGKNPDMPLELAINMGAQHVLRDALGNAMEKFSALGAAGLVVDVASGEVVSLVSLPDYDPHYFGRAEDQARFNRISLGVYELGSVFKAVNTAMALEAGIRITDKFDARKPIRISRFTIRDYHAKKRVLSVPEIFVYSSNIGSARMAMDVGRDGQQAFLRKLGLLDRPAFELPEIGRPLVPDMWRDVSTMTISYGHGLSVTPLQFAGAMTAMVNGGRLVPVTLLKRNGINRKGGGTVHGDQVLSPATSDYMRRLFRLVVRSGTARKAEAKGYLVGGKTGTAEKPVAGGYAEKALISSFVGAFPMHAPRYVVYVLLDEPQGIKETHGYATAGWTAAPTVSDVVRRIAPILGVDPASEEMPKVKNALALTLKGEPV